jgi:hypothetical protein
MMTSYDDVDGWPFQFARVFDVLNSLARLHVASH